MKSTNSNLGKTFKDSLDSYEVKPDGDLWSNIMQQNIQQGNVNNYVALYKVAASIAIIATVAVVSYFAFFYETKMLTNIDPIHIDRIDEKDDSQNNIVELNIITNDVEIVPATEIKNNTNLAENKKSIPKNKENELIEDNNTIENKSSLSYKKSKLNTTQAEVEITQDVIVLNEIKEPAKKDEVISKEELVEEYIEEDEIEAIHAIDTFKVVFGSDKTVCFGEDAILEIEEGYYYNWSSGDVSNKIVVSPTENSTYSVVVTNAKGQKCSHDFIVNIDRSCSALFIPSAFSPNADGNNDFFKAEGNGIQKMRMFVYDKLGNRVFETTNIDDSWDGTYKGRIVSDGMFFYHAEYTDAMGNYHIKKGQVTVIK